MANRIKKLLKKPFLTRRQTIMDKEICFCHSNRKKQVKQNKKLILPFYISEFVALG
jgi:hypothetical protein